MVNPITKTPLILFFIIISVSFVSASELTVTSVSPVNIIKNGDSVSGEILVDTTINGGGQSFMATLNPQDVRNFQSYGSDKPYPANSIQLEVTGFEEYVFYNINNNYNNVYKYQANEINPCTTSWLGYCNADAPSCSNGAEWELRDKSNFNDYIEERVCIKKEQVATLGDFDSSVIKFNADVKVSSGGKTKSKTISSGNEGQNAIDLGEAGVATWTGSKISGVSIPSVNSYLPLLQDESSNWKVISNQKKLDYEGAKNSLEGFLNANKQITTNDNDFVYKKGQLTPLLEDANNKANSLVNDVASLDYSYNQNGGQEGIIIDLTNRVTLPEILFKLKASWIGIVIPSGQPRISNVNADKFFSGQTGTIEVTVENIGEATGVFSIRLVGCEPFIVPETSISSRTNVAKGTKETIGIPISSGTLSEEYTKSCSIEIYDVNEPSHKDSAPLTLELGTAKICEPNKVFVDGNTIKKCDSKGKNVEILKQCPEGVKLYDDKGWDCVGEEKVIEGKSSKVKSFCSEDWECGTNYYCHPTINKCVQKSGCLELINNGNSEDKVDVVFVGDGYFDLEELKKDSFDIVDYDNFPNLAGLMSVEPFKSNKEKFNFWMVLGEDKIPENDYGDPSFKESLQLASQCTQGDYPVILSKKSFRSYAYSTHSAYLSFGAYSNPIGRGRLFLHEFGHAFGDLRDEYTEEGKPNRFSEPNCAPDVETAIQWWGDISGTDYFQGCSYVESNIRPTFNSIMRNHHNLKDDYGAVNKKALLNKLGGYK